MPPTDENQDEALSSVAKLQALLAEKEAENVKLLKNKEQQEYKMARLTEENTALKKDTQDIVAETVIKTVQQVEQKNTETKRTETLETELSKIPEADREEVRKTLPLINHDDVAEKVKLAFQFVTFNKVPAKTREQIEAAKGGANPIRTTVQIDANPDARPLNMDPNGKTASGYDKKVVDLSRDILMELNKNKALPIKINDIDEFLGRIM